MSTLVAAVARGRVDVDFDTLFAAARIAARLVRVRTPAQTAATYVLPFIALTVRVMLLMIAPAAFR
jgi:hypothetical protein